MEQWRIITKEKRAAIVVLDMPLLDTRQWRDLTGTLIADIVLQLLSYVAQTEREFIRQRQAEGIAAAKANGVRFGRRPMERPTGFDAVYAEWMTGKLSARAAAKRLGISRQTFLNWTKETVKNSTTLTASLCIAIFAIICYHFCKKLVNVALHTKVSCDVKQSVLCFAK